MRLLSLASVAPLSDVFPLLMSFSSLHTVAASASLAFVISSKLFLSLKLSCCIAISCIEMGISLIAIFSSASVPVRGVSKSDFDILFSSTLDDCALEFFTPSTISMEFSTKVRLSGLLTLFVFAISFASSLSFDTWSSRTYFDLINSSRCLLCRNSAAARSASDLFNESTRFFLERDASMQMARSAIHAAIHQ